jgi:hypothetical protein
LLLFGLVLSSAAAAIAMPATSFAYSCPSGQSYENDGDGDFVCFQMVKDENKGKPQGATDAGGNVINPKCGDGQVLDGGSCWTMKRENTTSVPKNNDGSDVDKGSYGCEAGFTYDGAKNGCFKCKGSSNYTPSGCTDVEKKNPIELKPDGTSLPTCLQGSGPLASGQKRCNSDGSAPAGTVVPRPNLPSTGNNGKTTGQGSCGEGDKVKYVLIPCTGKGGEAIASVLKLFIGILSLGVGITAVGGIAYGSILYAGARDNSGQVQQAITIIRTVLVGVLLYVLMVAILGWLVPGIWS